MAADSWFPAGLYHCQVAMRSSAGYPMGSDTSPDTQGSGDTNNAFKIPDPVEVSDPQITRDIAQFRAGLTIKGQRAMGTSDFGSFDLTLASYDETLHAMVSGSLVDTTSASGMTMTAPNTTNADLPQLILLLTLGAQNSSGTNEFVTAIWNNVQIGPAIPTAGQDSGTNPRPVVYTVTPSTSTRTGWGMLFTATALGVANNKDTTVLVRDTVPLALTTYIDDGSATTFVTGYRPVSSAIDGSDNIYLVDGVESSAQVSAHSVTTGATTHTAQAEFDIWTCLYGTNFVPI